jgi:hypothetical protein
LQEQAPNHLKLLGSRVLVVSVEEKAGTTCQVGIQETSVSEPLTTCRKRRDDVKTGAESLLRDESEGNLSTAQAASGMKAA